MKCNNSKRMKANEVFEKIYVHWSKHAKRLCASTAQGKGDIEYVRTDAFIEKAFKWLEENVERHISADGEYTVYYEEMFEELKKYMEGE